MSKKSSSDVDGEELDFESNFLLEKTKKGEKKNWISLECEAKYVNLNLQQTIIFAIYEPSSQKAISRKTVGMTIWQSKSLLSRSVKVFVILDLFFISHCGSLNSQIILYVWFLNLSYLVDFLVRLFQAKFNCKYKICMIWWISLSYVNDTSMN